MSSEDVISKHDWDNDAKWLSIRRAIEIPPHLNEETVLLKRKRKYYKENVDSSYEPPKDAPAPSPKPAAAPQPTSSSSSTSSRSSSDGTYGYGSAPNYGSSSANQVFRDTVVRGPLRTLSEMRGTVDMALHAIALLSFLYLVPLVPPQYAYLAISFAMKAIAVASALRVYYAFGLPQMSLDSVKAYFANAFSSNDFFHLIFILFCHMATPIFPFALWTGIVGASVSLAYVNTKFSNHPLAMKLRQPPLNAGLQVIPTLGEQVEMYLAWVELLMVFVSAVYLFTPARSLIFTFMITQFLRMRYLVSQVHRQAFAQLHARISARVASIPKVAEWYEWIAGKLYTFVDPDTILAQARQASQ